MNQLYLIAALITFAFTTVLTISGVGAAFILIPVFIAMGIPLLTAMSTALLLNSVSMAFASISFSRAKLILFRTAVPVLVAATVLSPLGAVTAGRLPESLLKWILTGFIVFAATMMLFYRPHDRHIEASPNKEIAFGAGVGSLAGFLGGLLGVGGGNIIAPALVLLGIDTRKAVATTAFIVIFSSLAGFLSHVSTGNVDIYLLALCVVGSIGGALLGAYLMRKKLNPSQVKLTLGIVLYLIAIKMVWDLLK
jgi:hypothetical protein